MYEKHIKPDLRQKCKCYVIKGLHVHREGFDQNKTFTLGRVHKKILHNSFQFYLGKKIYMHQKVLFMIVQSAPVCLSLQCYAANHKSSVSVHLTAAESGLMVTVGDRKGPLQVLLCSLHGEVLAHFSSI